MSISHTFATIYSDRHKQVQNDDDYVAKLRRNKHLPNVMTALVW